MSVLSDTEIKWLCVHHGDDEPLISPYLPKTTQDGVISFGPTHAGYDLRLGHEYKVFKNPFGVTVDPKRMKADPDYEKKFLEDAVASDGVLIVPGNSYILGYSIERMCMPNHLSGTCVGKSTYARCGVIINTTPLEPGWRGHLTIEIANASPCPVALFAGEGIAQLRFYTILGMVSQNYDQKRGKYQDQAARPIPATVKE